MAKKNKSRQWLVEHERDEFVRAARKSGYRSRSSYKLLAIQEKYSILKPGQTVLDLGSAPGGWSQVVKQLVTGSGRIIAVDLLEMQPIPDVEFIQGDFTENETLARIVKFLDGKPVDLVISDMAPNLSGMKDIDQPRAVSLVEQVLDLANTVLRPGGDLLAKCFEGAGVDQLRQSFRHSFHRVNNVKPAASRSRSREIYLLGRHLNEQRTAS